MQYFREEKIMANTIGTNYSMFQKMTGQVGGKRAAGPGKKEAAEERKPFGGFGDDVSVELSGAGLALAAQQKQDVENEAEDDGKMHLAEDKLSDKAKDFLAKLREQYGDYDFFAVDRIGDPTDASIQGTKAYSVILTTDEIEKMANDEAYAAEVMEKVGSAVDMTKRIEEKGELGEDVRFKHIAITFDNDGNMKLFAELEKMSEKQQERMEAAKEKRAEEKEEADRKKEKEAVGEEKERPMGIKSFKVEASTEEELLEKILGIDWDKVEEKG